MNNQEANMKTIEQLAIEHDLLYEMKPHVKKLPSTHFMHIDRVQKIANITSFIEAWNRQNSEPVATLVKSHHSIRVSDLRWFEKLDLPYGNYPLHLAPPQPQTVKDMLEKAVDVCQNWINTSTFYGYTGDAENYKAIQDEIRALIDQPQPPASQELMDYVHRLEKSNAEAKRILTVIDTTHTVMMPSIEDAISAEKWRTEYKSILQSKPAKG